MLKKFEVQLHDILEVRPYVKNPLINDSAADAVAESLSVLGVCRTSFRKNYGELLND